MSLTYPIVARKYEMVSSDAAVPIRVSIAHKIDVIPDSVSDGAEIVGVAFIHESYHLDDTEG